jgi:hypothetical protein
VARFDGIVFAIEKVVVNNICVHRGSMEPLVSFVSVLTCGSIDAQEHEARCEH